MRGGKDTPRRDINAVLRDHDRELMAIIVARKTRELERKIPRRLEGYQVVIEETGPIRPLPKQN
jgi:hypothetical protein